MDSYLSAIRSGWRIETRYEGNGFWVTVWKRTKKHGVIEGNAFMPLDRDCTFEEYDVTLGILVKNALADFNNKINMRRKLDETPETRTVEFHVVKG